MAVTVVDPPVEQPDHLPPPPKVVTTPCDPWPRPYFLKDGLRRVKPYHFTYNTNVKQRWRGREILDIFTDEFRDRPKEYYKDAIESGKIQVNGQPFASVTSQVKNGDVISHTLHRHEPPVTGQPIGIVHEDDDLIVINKPAGVPVHPAGRYNYNSVVEIMRAERGHQWNPLPVNRLDRLTSGVMFIGKHKKAAEKLTDQLVGRTVRKEYVARVRGEFPEGDVICEEPILQISPKLGLNRVRASGKSAKTVFKRLAYYPPKLSDSGEPQGAGYSIVRCLPLTGRTHQLRVHLQFLGHPITNDPIYANRRVFGANLGKATVDSDDDEDVMTRLSRMGKTEVADAVQKSKPAADQPSRLDTGDCPPTLPPSSALAKDVLNTARCCLCPSCKAPSATMEEQVDRLVKKAWFQFQDTPKSKRLLIAVSGIPGSGKTTLAAKVVARLNALWRESSPGLASEPGIATFLPMDGYHLTRAQLDAMPDPSTAHARRGAAFTFDAPAFLQLVRKLREPICPETGTLYAPSFDHAVKDPVANDIPIAASSRIVVMEGLYLSLGTGAPEWKDAALLMDELWFVEVPEQKAKERLVKRHVASGISPDEESAARRAEENDLVNGRQIVEGRLQVHEVIASREDGQWAPEVQGIERERDA